MKISIASIKPVSVKFDDGEFTAKLRVLRLSESEEMNDRQLVRAALSDKAGNLRADAVEGLEISDGEKTLSGLETVEACLDDPGLSAAIAGAYFREFRNKQLRLNSRQPD